VNNLLQNAFEHTPAGGKVLIRASRQKGRKTEAPKAGVMKADTPKAEAAKTGVLVEVLDTGLGIPEGDLPRVFDRFYRGEPSRTRTLGKHSGSHAGLGLTIARALVEAHGGEVYAFSPCVGWPDALERPASRPGSVFAFCLPVS
jgi:signal transduction histidine kinase